MKAAVTTELILIRHAPALSEGRVAGRRDVDADCGDADAFAGLRRAIGSPDRIYVSPARRCQQTAKLLWPAAHSVTDGRLWEQNFGDWEDRDYADLPDLGALTTTDLATHQPPKGESFLDVAKRCSPVIMATAAQGGKVVIVAHAGVIRAALGLALGVTHAGLAFQIAPLSMTTLIALPAGAWSIAGVNEAPR